MAFRIISAGMTFLACLAAATAAVGQPPHLGAEGQKGYQEYLSAPPHSAFAIAPGGAWAWVSGHGDGGEAERAAIAACREYTRETCQAYAIDGHVVFDEAAWAASWAPYPDTEDAARAPVGTGKGMRFPDLALNAPTGGPVTLSDFKGKVVFLHFWGSWCPPCQAEFPELQHLHDAFSDSPEMAFVFVQTREPIAKSRRWAKRNGLTLPLFDSGVKNRRETALGLADGTTIEDRRLAPVFPSTYVLDRNGVVVFAHTGPAADWPGYEPLLRHLLAATE